MTKREIIGVVLVRNEDLFLSQALANTAAFCDRFLLFDHGSSDETSNILSRFADAHADVESRRIRHPSESHDALRPLAGKEAWVFGVDGDEVYDPARLAEFKQRLLSGEFDNDWMLMGHCLHVDRIDGGLARGFPTPPSRSITKLYNFAAIDAWPGPSTERLHGGNPLFRKGFDATRKRLIFEETGWEDSPLRCLHFCFCRRSSREAELVAARPNIDETYNSPSLWTRLRQRLPVKSASSRWKHERYRRGTAISVDSTPFFPKC